MSCRTITGCKNTKNSDREIISSELQDYVKLWDYNELLSYYKL